jgi:hypothetical protein
MSDNPSGSSDADEVSRKEREWHTAVDKFEDEIGIGDTFFLFQSWSSWAVHPSDKRIAPFVRIALGDVRGNVVFNRSMVLTAVADLIEELSDTLLVELKKARDMPGFTLDVPGPVTAMTSDMENARSHLSAALDILAKHDLLRDGTVEAPTTS